MENITKTCIGFFILIVVCHLGKAQSPTTKKKIYVEISCKEINWTEHSRKACSAVITTDESIDSEDFQFTNLTFAREIRKFINPLGLNETCFEDGFQNVIVTEMNNSQIVVRSSSDRRENGFIYDVICSRTRIHLYDAKVTDMGPDGCDIKPLGVDDICRSQTFQTIVEVTATLERVNSTYFNVQSRSITRRTSEDDAVDCIITTNFNDTQFQEHIDEKRCNESKVFPPPTRGLNPMWNLYAWQKCSKLAFGDQVLHLDWRFDRWVLNNLTSLCGTHLPAMDSCMKENALAKTPILESFNFYSNLKNSYDDICANQNDFGEGHRCFQSIQSDKAMKDAYVSKVQQCYNESSSDVCKNIQCKADAQYKVYSNCTSFEVTYKYNRIIEYRNNRHGNCTFSKGHQIEISLPFLLVLFCLASWMNSFN